MSITKIKVNNAIVLQTDNEMNISSNNPIQNSAVATHYKIFKVEKPAWKNCIREFYVETTDSRIINGNLSILSNRGNIYFWEETLYNIFLLTPAQNNVVCEFSNSTTKGYIVYNDYESILNNIQGTTIYKLNNDNIFDLKNSPQIASYIYNKFELPDNSILAQHFGTNKYNATDISDDFTYALENGLEEFYLKLESSNADKSYYFLNNFEHVYLYNYTDNIIYDICYYNSSQNGIVYSNGPAYLIFKDVDLFKNTTSHGSADILVNKAFITNTLYSPKIQSYICHKDNFDENALSNILNLPDKLYAVRGDALQIFNRGIICSVNPYNYETIFSEVNYSGMNGRILPRYYEMNGDTTYNYDDLQLNVTIKDDYGHSFNKQTQIVYSGTFKQPVNPLNVLIIGDSLTAAGIYVSEANRRLTGSGGNPSGNEFSNINFVGRKNYYGTLAEGNSGWSWSDYTGFGRYAFTLTVSGINTLPSASQPSFYRDANGRIYYCAHVYSNTKIKFSDASTTEGTRMPNTGVLTKVSGAGDDTITYSAVETTSGNPFYNDSTGELDFQSYVNNYCNGTVDVIYTLLSWNAIHASDNFTTYATTLFSHIHTYYPNCKIKMLGIQVPFVRQGESNPRANGYSDMGWLMRKTFDLNVKYQNFANSDDFKDYVEFVNVSSQVDSEYGMPYVEKAVNARCTNITELVGNNGVHPNTIGYNQIADVIYRNFIGCFCRY